MNCGLRGIDLRRRRGGVNERKWAVVGVVGSEVKRDVWHRSHFVVFLQCVCVVEDQY